MSLCIYPDCPTCGNNAHVWFHEKTGTLWCLQAGCRRIVEDTPPPRPSITQVTAVTAERDEALARATRLRGILVECYKATVGITTMQGDGPSDAFLSYLPEEIRLTRKR